MDYGCHQADRKSSNLWRKAMVTLKHSLLTDLH
jgi:hypothetical protein